ncbi:MAG: lysophospholipid acyltransferase family protein [Myxococcales bacterium]
MSNARTSHPSSGQTLAAAHEHDSSLQKQLGKAMLVASGWTASGPPPAEKRYVLLAAPHTSNWDLPVMLALTMSFGLTVRWMGKHSLFKPPFGGFMKLLGGLPIERHKQKGVVEAVAEEYRNAEELIIAIPPEATRSRAPYWRSGFYHIARAAQVPIALGFLDYEKQIGGIGPLIQPSGDIHADMEKIRTFYAPMQGKFAENFAVPRLREEDESVPSRG